MARPIRCSPGAGMTMTATRLHSTAQVVGQSRGRTTAVMYTVVSAGAGELLDPATRCGPIVGEPVELALYSRQAKPRHPTCTRDSSKSKVTCLRSCVCDVNVCVDNSRV